MVARICQETQIRNSKRWKRATMENKYIFPDEIYGIASERMKLYWMAFQWLHEARAERSEIPRREYTRTMGHTRQAETHIWIAWAVRCCRMRRYHFQCRPHRISVNMELFYLTMESQCTNAVHSTVVHFYDFASRIKLCAFCRSSNWFEWLQLISFEFSTHKKWN